MKVWRILGSAIVGLIFTAPTGAQTAQLMLDGVVADAQPIVLGDMATLTVQGSPLANFSLIGSQDRDVWVTPLGVVEVDVFDPTFFVALDGFDPNSANFAAAFLDAAGTTQLGFTPFPVGWPGGSRVYFQALVADATVPFGVALTPLVGGVAVPPTPMLTGITPRSANPGQTVTIGGNYLGGIWTGGVLPTVTLEGQPMTVLSADENAIQAIVPAGARSGYVEVTTTGGSGPPLYDDHAHYLSIYGLALGEANLSNSTITEAVTILGSISQPGEEDDYTVHLVRGEELRIEVFNFSYATLDIAPYTPYGGGLDTRIEIFDPLVNVGALQEDNNSGPGFSAAMGWHTGPRFVAPALGDYVIRVRGTNALAVGDYYLGIWTNAPDPDDGPIVYAVDPNFAQVGLPVRIISNGLDPSNLAASSVEFPGPDGSWLTSSPYFDSWGRIVANVPQGARSGHLRVKDSEGRYSTFMADTFGSYVLIQAASSGPATTGWVSESTTIVDSLPAFQAHVINVDMDAGQKLSVRAFPFDLVTQRLLKGYIFQPGILDPEVVIGGQGGQGFYVSDTHSGPATAAEIGGALHPAWTAPATGTYGVTLRGWLFLSSGSYVLNIEID